MFKLGFEEAEEPEIKLPTFVGSWRKQRDSRKISTFASLTMLKPMNLWITKNCGKFLEMGIPNHLTCLLGSLYVGQEVTELDMGRWTGSESGKKQQQRMRRVNSITD